MSQSFGSRSLPPPNADERERHVVCRAAGCIACHLLRLPKELHCSSTFEYNHVVYAGQHVGHRYGYSLGLYHHQARNKPGVKLEEMQRRYGPNIRDQRRAFHAYFGTDQALQNAQDDLLGVLRVEIPSHRQLRLERGHAVRRKPSQCTASSKTMPRNWWKTVGDAQDGGE